MIIQTIDRRSYGERASSFYPETDVAVFGFGCTETVRYRKELSGETSRLKDLSALSEKAGIVLVAAFDSDNYGIIRHSCGVFDKGKLLGITDMSVCRETNGYMPGCGNRVYDTAAGRFAVAVGDDAFSFDLMKSLVVCGAEAVLLLSEKKRTECVKIILRAYSYLLGVPFFYLGDDGGEATAPNGEPVPFSGEKGDRVELTAPADFTIKTTKVRFSDP